jgi:hypothetical protein
MSKARCSNGGEYECMCVIDRKSRRKETTSKNKTRVDNIRIRIKLGDIGWGGYGLNSSGSG